MAFLHVFFQFSNFNGPLVDLSRSPGWLDRFQVENLSGGVALAGQEFAGDWAGQVGLRKPVRLSDGVKLTRSHLAGSHASKPLDPDEVKISAFRLLSM